VIAIQQQRDALVHFAQHSPNLNAVYLNPIEQVRLRQHFQEFKAAAQRNIQPRQGSVSGVHGADQIFADRADGHLDIEQHLD